MKKKWYSLTRLVTPVIYSALLFFGILYKDFTLVIALMGTALFLGAFHCGWLCPFGFLQEMLGKLGRALKLPRLNPPAKWDRYLRFLRYILFALGFLGLGFTYFLSTPYGSTMAFVSGSAAALTWATGLLLAAFLLLSLVMDRPFCRYFCTEGARYGALSMGRLFSIRRNTETCVNCKACDRACPMGIEVSKVKHVRNGQCINCFECVAACPKDKTLQYGWAFKKPAKENNNDKKD